MKYGDEELEDFKREMINRWPNGIATNYDDFVSTVLSAVQETLNSPTGRELVVDPLLEESIRNNATPEEWQQKKVNLIRFMFFFAVDNLPWLKKEMAHHLYHELRKEVSK